MNAMQFAELKSDLKDAQYKILVSARPLNVAKYGFNLALDCMLRGVEFTEQQENALAAMKFEVTEI